MNQTEKNTKKITYTLVPLTLIGIVSSFVFVLTAIAGGVIPADVIALANTARIKAGLPALTENSKLSLAAKNKANDMIKNDYFAHTSPKGLDPWYWIQQSGYQYKAAGENLAINYTNAKEQHTAWMKSATHRANILSSRYREIGVAVVKGKIDGKESIVTVEFFGTPLYAVADKVAPVPPVAVEAALPAIKGIESAEALLPRESQPQFSVPLMESVVPATTAMNQTPARSWLDISLVVTLILIGFSLLGPALLMNFRMYQHLKLSMRAKDSSSPVTTSIISHPTVSSQDVVSHRAV